ncbi:YfhJ family protein [Halobacillus campisalis]|uniref:YfhJ family protein n=1 Tax=Halobacillus campisalis TaxID=435909 RepID=A0ABW2K295_9BACI|nr:YfhJ family protein [Halobacillus campisalis]
MDGIHQRLAEQLYEKNERLTIDEARTWVELLWEDFEATRAKAGRKYQGKQVTEQIVTQWINHYGPNLHEFIATNPKFKELLKRKGYLH